jgi:hypothetical protein
VLLHHLSHVELRARQLTNNISRAFVLSPSSLSKRSYVKLHDSKKALKDQQCKHRGQMMQCRVLGNLIVDFFGPETVFSNLTALTVGDVFPLRTCHSGENVAFPCPLKGVQVLKQFTLNVAPSRYKDPPRAWREFHGCALFPPQQQRTDAQLFSILNEGVALDRCGMPTLLREEVLVGSGPDRDDCTSIARTVLHKVPW